ncbi:MAG: glycosyltransferase, partial [Acidimicrobiales bacterium]
MTAGAAVVAVVAAKDAAASVGQVVATLRRVPAVDEVVVVDDGSSDHTALVAEAAGARVVRLARNAGKGAAVAAGLAVAPLAACYLLVDADVTTEPAELQRLLAPVVAGESDLAVGVLPGAGAGGGFGLVRLLAAAGIRRGSGLVVRAPL